MNRQKVRNTLSLFMFVLFPLIYYYFSPYLVIMGAMEGIITGSLLVFGFLFVSSIFLGRTFCGWICPGGATQELCARVNNSDFKNGKRNWIKYAIWVPWVSVIVLMFVRAGGIASMDPFWRTYYGLSITGIYSIVIFMGIFALIAGTALLVGKRAFCHTICWMAPFMILGRKIANILKLPALRLSSNENDCVDCKVCSKKCPMSLDVNDMVKTKSLESSECVLCGSCVDYCPKGAIEYSFGRNK